MACAARPSGSAHSVSHGSSARGKKSCFWNKDQTIETKHHKTILLQRTYVARYKLCILDNFDSYLYSTTLCMPNARAIKKKKDRLAQGNHYNLLNWMTAVTFSDIQYIGRYK